MLGQVGGSIKGGEVRTEEGENNKVTGICKDAESKAGRGEGDGTSKNEGEENEGLELPREGASNRGHRQELSETRQRLALPGS